MWCINEVLFGFLTRSLVSDPSLLLACTLREGALRVHTKTESHTNKILPT